MKEKEHIDYVEASTEDLEGPGPGAMGSFLLYVFIFLGIAMALLCH